MTRKIIKVYNDWVYLWRYDRANLISTAGLFLCVMVLMVLLLLNIQCR